MPPDPPKRKPEPPRPDGTYRHSRELPAVESLPPLRRNTPPKLELSPGPPGSARAEALEAVSRVEQQVVVEQAPPPLSRSPRRWELSVEPGTRTWIVGLLGVLLGGGAAAGGGALVKSQPPAVPALPPDVAACPAKLDQLRSDLDKSVQAERAERERAIRDAVEGSERRQRRTDDAQDRDLADLTRALPYRSPRAMRVTPEQP